MHNTTALFFIIFEDAIYRVSNLAIKIFYSYNRCTNIYRILDHDACNKLQKWFSDRWQDYGCVDISQELAEIIDRS
ncbi:MAG: hypothetical protein V7K25_13150 [Nostoc sp.]|uniref:hypothetical protein n=1 Tax=Nostoc sp. TaxID=1180 RepID=UPI002FFC7470